MSLRALNSDEKQVIYQCLRAAADGPFFPDWEFHTLFGLHRHEVAKIVEALPDIDDGDEPVSLAINNALNNLLGYPHGEEEAWRDFISVPGAEVERIFEKWKNERKDA